MPKWLNPLKINYNHNRLRDTYCIVTDRVSLNDVGYGGKVSVHKIDDQKIKAHLYLHYLSALGIIANSKMHITLLCIYKIKIIMATKALVAASSKPLILSILSHGKSYGYEIIKNVIGKC